MSRLRPLLAAALALMTLVWPAPAAAASPTSAWRWPLAGTPVVLRGFEPPPTPYAAGHRGVDLAADQGQPVYAAGAGVVAYAGLVGGVGVVTVRHAGGLRTTYEPVAAQVTAGMTVAAGSVVGVVSGQHAGCPRSCLHWGLLRGETYLDPLSLLRGRVRLLPLDGSAVAGVELRTPAAALPRAHHTAAALPEQQHHPPAWEAPLALALSTTVVAGGFRRRRHPAGQPE